MAERFSASVAGRHMACHASADLGAAIPHWVAPVEDPSAVNAANDGTKMHEIVEPIMHLPLARQRQLIKYLEYVADVRALRRFTTVLVEETREVEWLQSKPKTTVDYALATQDELHILDGKWGKIPVSAVNNTQLLYYAVTFADLAPKAKGVTLHVMQPAIDNFDSWFADTNVLAKFKADALATEAAIAAGDTTFGPGDHCTFCAANPHGRGLKGRPFCPVLMSMFYPDHTDEDAILTL
jgi:hypothetical protein